LVCNDTEAKIVMVNPTPFLSGGAAPTSQLSLSVMIMIFQIWHDRGGMVNRMTH